ncbi:hypothetical protein BJ742DRAFT_739718 [Cladochytrium replicatum]|nr:hypothetical protein BJ742DRAFT_739718 [Cladochytrium replicatum]
MGPVRSGKIQLMCDAQNARMLDNLEMDAIHRAQHFGGADERSDPAGYMDNEDRGCHVTWAGIARGKRRNGDGHVESGSLQQQVVKMAAMALETSTQFAEIEAVRNGIADAVATVVQSETQKIREDARNGKKKQQRYLDKIMGGQSYQIATHVSQLGPFPVGLEDTGSVQQINNVPAGSSLTAADGGSRSCGSSPEKTIAEKCQLENIKEEGHLSTGEVVAFSVNHNMAQKWAPTLRLIGALRVHEMGNSRRWRTIWDSVGEQNCKRRTQSWKAAT